MGRVATARDPTEPRALWMLVLTRKLMEKLYIGENICVTVVRLEGGQVRLGIEAPREIPVVRAELRRDPPPPVESGEDEPTLGRAGPIRLAGRVAREIGIRPPGRSR